MSETLATWLVYAALVYAAVGTLFALAFAVRGAGRVDPVARGATWGFRVLVVPGAAFFWPLLGWRWLRGGPPPVEKNAHRAAAGRSSS